ncbi:MAG TPA: ABC transporter substrate-binding protein, partial [Patescibacteria group bacterium]|nr:ABC transporter substrate-binding protein [Patescibacteria group bacterium]
MSFLKSRVSGLKKISSKITGNQEKGNLISQRSILSKQADQKLVFSLSKHSLPTFSQLKTLPKFFSPREKRTVRLLIYAIMLSLILLAVNFYYSHSVLVAKTGGTYTEGLVGTPQYINPILSSYNDVDRDLASLIFNGLLKYNDEDDIEPDLAEEFQISPDRKIYTFKLRQGVKWHDGEPLTADDVIFTVSSIQDPEWQSQLKSALDNVQVEKIDDYSLRF